MTQVNTQQPEPDNAIDAEAEVVEPAEPTVSEETALATRVEQPSHERELQVYNAMTAARDWPQLLRLADGMYRSRMVPQGLRSVEAVAVVLVAGSELGMGPMEAVQNLHVVNNKIGMDATKMRSRVYERIPGADIEVVEATAQRCVLVGTRPGKTPVEVVYTIEDAERAHLTGKDNWKNYPGDMLMARATSRLVRRQFPDALSGAMYTPEELESIGPDAMPAPMQAADAPEARTRAQRAAAPSMQEASKAALYRWWPNAKARWPGEADQDLVARFRLYVNGVAGQEISGPSAWTPEVAAAVNAALDASDDPRPPEPNGGA